MKIPKFVLYLIVILSSIPILPYIGVIGSEGIEYVLDKGFDLRSASILSLVSLPLLVQLFLLITLIKTKVESESYRKISLIIIIWGSIIFVVGLLIILLFIAIGNACC